MVDHLILFAFEGSRQESGRDQKQHAASRHPGEIVHHAIDGCQGILRDDPDLLPRPFRESLHQLPHHVQLRGKHLLCRVRSGHRIIRRCAAAHAQFVYQASGQDGISQSEQRASRPEVAAVEKITGFGR